MLFGYSDQNRGGLDAAVSGSRWPSTSSVIRKRRYRIIFVSLVLSVVAALIELGLPAEDTFRALRDMTRHEVADRNIVVVTIDDRTLNMLGANPSRSDDAAVIDRLASSGAQRIFFDRAHADPSSQQADSDFREALERAQGRVFLGAFPDVEDLAYSNEAILPLREFRGVAGMASMMGETGPFSLSYRFPTSTLIDGQRTNSIAGEMANYRGEAFWFRPDFAIDMQTIPTVSYIDVLQGRVPASFYRAKDFIIADTSIAGRDFHPLPLGSKAPGVFFHVVAAKTLKNGAPANAGWLPLTGIALVLLVLASSRPGQSAMIGWATAGLVIAAPFLGDRIGLSLDAFPALFLCVVGFTSLSWRLHSLRSEIPDLWSFGIFRTKFLAAETKVFALKLKNFGSVSARLTADEKASLIHNLISRIRTSEGNCDFAFERDVLVWVRPAVEGQYVVDHILGLHSLLRIGLYAEEQMVDLSSTIGVDVRSDLPLRVRLESALHAAEEAVRTGNVYRIVDALAGDEDRQSLRLLSDLDEALGENEVEVVFQPKIELSTGVLLGAEALVRWNHPTEGQISPEAIVSLSEEHDRIGSLTTYVIKRAHTALENFRQHFPNFTMSVNISPKSLADQNFLADIRDLTATLEIEPEAFILEITEQVSIKDPRSRKSLDQLQMLGFRLSIDDFGIGMATIDYLRQINSEEVKIDKSFIANVEASSQDQAIVRAAILMIHSLGRKVVAEGIETKGAMDLLTAYGCDIGQGYLFSAPVPASELLRQFTRRKLAG